MILKRKFTRSLRMSALFFGILLTSLILRISYAGSLAPSTPPTPTMYDLSDIYDPLASTSYDSSGISADANGSALEITKCIILKQNGGNC